MSNPNIPIRRTGSADNERVQLNKALSGVDETLERADQWDASFAWGDHRDAGYEVALTESQVFENLGVPSGLSAIQLLDTDPSGSDRIALQISWNRIGDESISYDLEIRKSAIGVTTDPLDNADLYSVPIIANDLSVSTIRYTDFFDPDVRYWFRVRIRRDRFVSPWSAFVNIATTKNLATPPTPTLAPLMPFLEGIKLDWSGYPFSANPNVAFIEVQRNGSTIERVSRPATQYLDEPLDPSITYSYRIRAVSYAGVESAFSVTRTASPQNQDDGNVVIRSATAPTTRPPEGSGPALRVGDRWLKSNEGDLPHSWDGQQWRREYTIIDGGTITTGTIDAQEVIIINLNADNITTGTIDADEIAVINLDADNITTGTIDADEIAVINLDADNITTGNLNVDLIQNGSLGSIKFANTIQSLDYSQGSSGWAITTGFDPNFPFGAAEFQNLVARGTMRSGTFTSGTEGWEINADGSAEFNNVTARGSLIAGSQSPTTRRVEITPTAVPADFVIWAGRNAKTDANGIFWVKADGTAKIDKQTFDISDGNLVVGVFSASNSGTGQGNTNTLTATSANITTTGSGVKFDVNFQFTGVIQTLQTTSCAAPAVTGTIQLQRRVAPSGAWTTVDSATINPPGSATYVPTNEAGLAPGVCTANVIADLIKSFIDTPSSGTYNYRVLFSSWFSPFTTAQIDKNEFRVAFTLTE